VQPAFHVVRVLGEEVLNPNIVLIALMILRGPEWHREHCSRRAWKD
jgi:hypothetical protein